MKISPQTKAVLWRFFFVLAGVGALFLVPESQWFLRGLISLYTVFFAFALAVVMMPQRVVDAVNEQNAKMAEELEKKMADTNINQAMFEEAIRASINKHAMESGSNTPDFILARYLKGCLDNFDQTVRERENWKFRDN